MRQCAACKCSVRLRTGTVFENLKIPILLWMQALYFVMQDKRGMSALSLQRILGLTRYETAWTMLMRIRRSLMERDRQYKLNNRVEVDGAFYGKKRDKNDLRLKHTHSKSYVENLIKKYSLATSVHMET